jgi:hypothetical protein
MSHLILRLFGWPTSELAGLNVKPRPIDDGIGASRYAVDGSPHAVGKRLDTAKRHHGSRLWFGPGSEVDISRANYTWVEESMLNLS